LLVAPDPEQPERHRVLASSKSTLGPPMLSLRYTVLTGDPMAAPAVEAGTPPTGAPPTAAPRIAWLGAVAYRANQVLAEQGTLALGGAGTGGRQTSRAAARALLRRELASGPRPVAEVKAQALEEGFSEGTFARASGAVAQAHPGACGGPWLLRLRAPASLPHFPQSPSLLHNEGD
jgi:hypothetical protein